MGLLNIVEKDAPWDDEIDWPVFYMNDFSILGLIVDGLEKASQVLEADGYQIDRKACSAKVHFDNNNRFNNIFNTLQQHQINYVMSDLVRCAYQG